MGNLLEEDIIYEIRSKKQMSGLIVERGWHMFLEPLLAIMITYVYFTALISLYLY